ncbi:MAG: SIS domain-containing protein [Nitrososphaerales archaeon]
MYKMYKMILKQPVTIQDAIESCAKDVKKAVNIMMNRRVYLTGCGSSFHAAIYGEFVLRKFGFDVHAVQALDMIHYTPKLNNSTVIVISHSWKTRTTLKAVDVINHNEIPCIGITANERAKKDVDVLLRTSTYYDESDCVTMGYTTQLAALAQIAEHNTANKQIQNVPLLLKNVLNTENKIRELATKYSKHRRFFVLGAGPNTATAFEMALKMKEGNFTDTEGVQMEQMLHGSISGIDEEDVVFLIAPKDAKTRHRVYDTAKALGKIGVSTIVVTDDATEITKECKHAIKIGYSPEYLNPIVSILPLQLFAYFIAEKNGINPDQTREEDLKYRKAYGTLFLHFK